MTDTRPSLHPDQDLDNQLQAQEQLAVIRERVSFADQYTLGDEFESVSEFEDAIRVAQSDLDYAERARELAKRAGEDTEEWDEIIQRASDALLKAAPEEPSEVPMDFPDAEAVATRGFGPDIEQRKAYQDARRQHTVLQEQRQRLRQNGEDTTKVDKAIAKLTQETNELMGLTAPLDGGE